MAKRSTVPAPSALDSHHPLIRRMVRSVQLRDRALRDGTIGDGDPWRLAHIGELLVLVAQHIATARPRVEHDEAAREGRPPATPDLLHPALESAIDRHLAGDDGREGDRDAEAEADPDFVTAALAKAVRS